MNGDAMDQEIIDALDYCAHWYDHEGKCLGCERHGTGCDTNGYEKIPRNLLEDALALLQRRADAYNEARAAWELARKIHVPVQNGGLSHTEMVEIFGIESCTIVKIMDLGYEEALRRYREYQERQFQVGDEVEIDTGIGVVTKCSDNAVTVLKKNGIHTMRRRNEAKKTGRHFDEVEQLLAKIGEP